MIRQMLLAAVVLLLGAGVDNFAALTAQRPTVRPRVSTPRVSTPRPSPRISTPRPSPRISTPRATPRISTPRATPRISTPRATPRISTPRPSPRVTSPRITTPRYTTPGTSPRITTPRYTTPGTSPRVTTPRYTPRVTTPRTASPGSATRITSPRYTTPRPSSPRITTPRYSTPRTTPRTRVDSLPRAIGGSSSGTRSRLQDLYERRNATTRQPDASTPPSVRPRGTDGDRSGTTRGPAILRERTPTRVSAGGGASPRAGSPRIAAPRGTEPTGTSPRVTPRTPRSGGTEGAGRPRLRPIAEERYRGAGRPSPADPAPRIRNRGGSSVAGSGPRLRQRDSIRAGTPVRPTLRGGPGIASNGPRLGGPRSGGFGSRFGDSYWNHGYRYNGTNWLHANRFLNGCYHWSGHFGAFHPWRQRWGAYYYPFLHCGLWSDFWWNSRSSFVLSWNSWAPAQATVAWWWPNGTYVPGTWLGGGFGGGFSTVDWGYVPSSAAFVGGVGAGGDAGGAAPVAGGEAAAAPAEPEISPARRHLNLGDYYFRQGRYEEAAESYLRALAYAPDDGSIHFVIADALFAEGDYHYAAYMIGKGLELDPSLADAKADKHTFYEDPEDFDRQLDALREYLGDKPFDAAAHLVMGYNLVFGGETELAVAAFSRVLDIDPGNRAARAFLGSLAEDGEPAEREAADRPRDR